MSILRKLAKFEDTENNASKPVRIKPKRNKLSFRNILLVAICVSIIFTIKYNLSKEKIEEKAYDDVIKELQVNNNPTGMLGANWFMTQQEVKNLFNDYHQIDVNTIARSAEIYDRSIQASYHFKDDKLMQITISFQDEFKTPQEMSDAYYATQKQLSLDYGQMSDPTVNEIITSTNNELVDQDFLISKKQMGRTTLVHRIRIQDNGAGEQIYMYLSKE